MVSYDSNIITGGSGARYFGAGASAQYRQDRITIYLRAVSTSSGQILKNVYVSKTILSQGISANLFRYVKLRRLLEAETGVTKNEPTQLAIKEAIDKAVELLIVEGMIDGLWTPQGGQPVIDAIKERYLLEKEDAESTDVFDRKFEDRRGKSAVSMVAGIAQIYGDYPNSVGRINTGAAYKFYFKKPTLNLNFGMSYFQLENEQIFSDDFLAFDINLEYDLLPYDRVSPFVYGGIGTISKTDISNPYVKFQYGLGVEYLVVNNIGIKLFGEHSMLLTDKLDGITQGKRDDYFMKFGVGVNFYIGKPYKRVKALLVE